MGGLAAPEAVAAGIPAPRRSEQPVAGSTSTMICSRVGSLREGRRQPWTASSS
jgi:hypothetical protein